MGYTGKQKREYQRLWIESRRKAWFDENGPCVKCGSWNDLEADHIDPSTKLYDPKYLWSLSDSNPKKILELAKLQVLCEDCHAEKSLSERFIQTDHKASGATMYRNGCRCADCRNNQRLRIAEQRENKRRGLTQLGSVPGS